MTDWQQRGCPYTPGPAGMEGAYDPIAIARWAAKLGLGEPRANSPSTVPETTSKEDMNAQVTGPVVGKLLSEATIPVCLGMMEVLGVKAAASVRMYQHLVQLLVTINDRLCGADANYPIEGALAAIGDTDLRAKLIDALEQRQLELHPERSSR